LCNCKLVQTERGREGGERERERERERDRDIRSPECQIVTEKLHDQCAVLVRLLTQSIQLGNSLIKSLTKKSIF
jgi:hypothetical protein